MTGDQDNQGRLPRPSAAHRLRAQALRRDTTPAEQLLWHELRGRRLGVKFRRQHPLGRFIADFCCLERRLIVEVDGAAHADQAAYDTARTEALAVAGYTVLRFSNTQVLHDRPAVLAQIRQALAARPGDPAPAGSQADQ